MPEPLLTVENLHVTLTDDRGKVKPILEGVSFEVYPHEVMGLVGESGSGKSMTALAIMGLLPRGAKVRSGRIWFAGRDLLATSPREFRGTEIAMIFQNPRAALNPLMRVGNQVARVVRLHQKLGQRASQQKAIELLQRVGISDTKTWARAYPHQLSGGMAQRVLIAMMLACQPRLLIADEPTTGLDVTIQAQIFDLIKNLQAELGTTLLLITHDLGVVSEVCQRVAVMQAGKIQETASVMDIFARPQRPYTQQLMSTVLRIDRPTSGD